MTRVYTEKSQNVQSPEAPLRSTGFLARMKRCCNCACSPETIATAGLVLGTVIILGGIVLAATTIFVASVPLFVLGVVTVVTAAVVLSVRAYQSRKRSEPKSTQEDIRIDTILMKKQSELGLNYAYRYKSDKLDIFDEFDESALLKNRLQHSIIRNGRRWSTADINETEIKYTEQVTAQDEGNVWFTGSDFIKSTSLKIKNGGSVLACTRIPMVANFQIEYAKSMWVITRAFKYTKANDFFMSEIVRMQFKLASKKGGFEGILPSIICSKNVVNENSLIFIKKYKHLKLSFKGFKFTQEIVAEFLSLDGNGKSTRHILNTFRMQAIDIDINSESNSIYIHVRPMKEGAIIS